jgi:hypothetical protein
MVEEKLDANVARDGRNDNRPSCGGLDGPPLWEHEAVEHAADRVEESSATRPVAAARARRAVIGLDVNRYGERLSRAAAVCVRPLGVPTSSEAARETT